MLSSIRRNFCKLCTRACSASTASVVQPSSSIAPDVEELLQPAYQESLQHADYFNVRELVSMEAMVTANMHLGHKRDCGHDGFREFLYGTRIEYDIIDLDKTLPRFHLALNFIAHLVFRNGAILFVTRPSFRDAHYVERLAVETGQYCQTRSWRPGDLPVLASREAAYTRMPDAAILFCCHDATFQPHAAIKDCAELAIPTLALVDSNCDPRPVTFPVPANDDSPTSIRFFGSTLSAAISKGQTKRLEILNQLGVYLTEDELVPYNRSLFAGPMKREPRELRKEHKQSALDLLVDEILE